MSTSLSPSSAAIRACPALVLRSRRSTATSACISAYQAGESARNGSPAGGSSLVTRAPARASRAAASGPGTFCATVRIRTPSRYVVECIPPNELNSVEFALLGPQNRRGAEPQRSHDWRDHRDQRDEEQHARRFGQHDRVS